MSNVTSKQIPVRIEEVKAEFLEWAKGMEDYLQGVIGKTPCIYTQKMSAHRYHVGWRFTKRGTPIGEVQKDAHVAYNPDQTIVWTYEGEADK